MTQQEQASRQCAKCGGALVHVIYGLADPSAFEEEERGEIVLAGCDMWPDAPRYACPACRLGLTPP